MSPCHLYLTVDWISFLRVVNKYFLALFKLLCVQGSLGTSMHVAFHSSLFYCIFHHRFPFIDIPPASILWTQGTNGNGQEFPKFGMCQVRHWSG